VAEILKTQDVINNKCKAETCMKTRRILILIDILLLISTLAFIWGNSLESVSESGAKSQSILSAVAPILEIFVGEGRVTDHIVRKIAHFAEFGLLGCELMLLVVLRRRVRVQNTVNCLSAALTTAVIDEALQLLSDRGAQVSDVLLDFCGAASGIFFVLLLYGISRAAKHK